MRTVVAVIILLLLAATLWYIAYTIEVGNHAHF